MPSSRLSKPEELRAAVVEGAAFAVSDDADSLAQREQSVARREVAVEKREDAVQRREDALEEHRRRLEQREARVEQREAVLYAGIAQNGSVAMPNEAPKKGRHSDPINDVPALVDQYQTSGGIVPLGVLVAEVEAVQQAATRLQAVAASCDVQIAQLDLALSLKDKLGFAQQSLMSSQARLQEEKMIATTGASKLIVQYDKLRDKGVERFTPLLLQTVSKYQARFDGVVDDSGESALQRVCLMCKEVSAKGRTLRQQLPSAMPKESLDTLMLLMDLAIQAGPKLRQLAYEAASSVKGCEVVTPPKPTKGLARALQKVQEEYESDYTRLLDYARITIVCAELPALASVLEWLLAAARAPRFTALRTKDRFSRVWDSELSGGNRDVMINGWLQLGGGRAFIVEVQLHLRALYELKSDLHVLYVGARVLGAMEDATARHEGLIDDSVVDRVNDGVVRKLVCHCSPMTVEQRQKLCVVLQNEPCALLNLELQSSQCDDQPAFDGWTLKKLLVPETGTVACRRLRGLNLIAVGLTGEIPTEIARCTMLVHLRLGHNTLTGGIPEWLSELPGLEHAHLSNCLLTGPIPASIGRCACLTYFNVRDNQLSGELPVEALKGLKNLEKLEIGPISSTEKCGWSQELVSYHQARDIYYPNECGNEHLTITALEKATLEAAMPLLKIRANVKD